MGAKNSTPAAPSVTELENESSTLGKGVDALKAAFQELSGQFFSKEEVDAKLNKIYEDQSVNSDKLSQLLDLGIEQQQVITDLGSKYSQLYDDYCKQQKMFVEMTGKYEDKFQRYEENLKEAKSKIFDLEKEVKSNTDITEVLGIRKTENMIKRERINLRSNTKKITPEKAKAAQSEPRSKTKEKLQSARDQKKMKELHPSVSNPEGLTRFELTETTVTSESQPSYLGTTTFNQKLNCKDTFLELNNTL